VTKPKAIYLADPAPMRGKRYLSTAEMCRRYDWSPTTLARRRLDPDFPKAVQFGGISSPNMYLEAEVDHYDAAIRETALAQPPRPLPSRAFVKKPLSTAPADAEGGRVTKRLAEAEQAATEEESAVARPVRRRGKTLTKADEQT
jgi:hypothetical protein